MTIRHEHQPDQPVEPGTTLTQSNDGGGSAFGEGSMLFSARVNQAMADGSFAGADIPIKQLDAWLGRLAVAIAADPPRRWAPLNRDSGLWPIGRSLYVEAMAGKTLTPMEEAMALSYVNSRSQTDVADDSLLALSATRPIPSFGDDGGWLGRRTGVDASMSVHRVFDILGTPWRLLDPIRIAMNRAPLRIIFLGPMGVGDFVFAIAGIFIVAAVLVWTGVWTPS